MPRRALLSCFYYLFSIIGRLIVKENLVSLHLKAGAIPLCDGGLMYCGVANAIPLTSKCFKSFAF